MQEEQRVAAGGRAAHEHATWPVVPRSARDLDRVQLGLRVLPVGALGQAQAARPGQRAPFLGLLSCSGGGSGRGRSGRSRASLLGHLHCGGGLGRQEGQLGDDRTRAGGPAEEPAQLAHLEAVHSLQVGGPLGSEG